MGPEQMGLEEMGPYRVSGAPDPIFDTDFAPWARLRRSQGLFRALEARTVKTGRAETSDPDSSGPIYYSPM